MVSRYPDSVVITWKDSGTYDNATGNFTAGATLTKTVKGRADANGAGSLITLEDGTQVVYSFIFVSEKQNFTAPINASVNLNSGQWIGKVKRHVNHQTNSRIWL